MESHVGNPRLLNSAEEEAVIFYLKLMSERGWGLSVYELRLWVPLKYFYLFVNYAQSLNFNRLVLEFMQSKGQDVTLPSGRWASDFVDRYRTLSLRKCKNISTLRQQAMTPAKLEDYFMLLKDILGVIKILNHFHYIYSITHKFLRIFLLIFCRTYYGTLMKLDFACSSSNVL